MKLENQVIQNIVTSYLNNETNLESSVALSLTALSFTPQISLGKTQNQNQSELLDIFRPFLSQKADLLKNHPCLETIFDALEWEKGFAEYEKILDEFSKRMKFESLLINFEEKEDFVLKQMTLLSKRNFFTDGFLSSLIINLNVTDHNKLARIFPRFITDLKLRSDMNFFLHKNS